MKQRSRRSKIDTPTARANLPISKKPQYKSLEPGVFIGYRRGQIERRWVARIYNDAERKYAVTAIGHADDADAPAGQVTMTYAEARDAVLALASRSRLRAAADPLPTVRSAIQAYIEARDARETKRRGREVKSDAHRLAKHVLGDVELADLPIEELSKRRLAKWRAGLGGAASSRQRTANDFRAALFAAEPGATVRLEISEGLKIPDAEEGEAAPRDNQILSDAEVRRIITAARDVDADGDLYRMVLILAATGARFSQVRRLRVIDVQETRLMMPSSRKGRKRSSDRPAVPVPVGPDVIAALQVAAQGRKGTDPLLERWRHRQAGHDPKTGRMVWEREGRGPWTSASELTRPFAAVAKAAGMVGTIPYALRHSSIVRALRPRPATGSNAAQPGLPIRLVAALHDTSVAMIERHYGRWIADGLEELAARAVVPMIEHVADANVIPFEGAAR